VPANKWDLNPDLADESERVAEEMGASRLGRIPFSVEVGEATAEGVPLVEWGDREAAEAVRKLRDDTVSLGAPA